MKSFLLNQDGTNEIIEFDSSKSLLNFKTVSLGNVEYVEYFTADSIIVTKTSKINGSQIDLTDDDIQNLASVLSDICIIWRKQI